MAAFRHYDSLPANLDDDAGRARSALLLGLFTWGLYFFWIGPRLWFEDLTGIYASYAAVAAAWPENTALASLFGFRDLADWFSGHPQMISAPLGGDFLIDALAGLLLRAGLAHGPALMLSGIFAALVLLAGLLLFLRASLDSTGRAWLGATLFLAAGGLGAMSYVQGTLAPLLADEPSWTAFARQFMALPPREYTLYPALGVEVGNPLLALLLPQREVLFGMGVTLLLLVPAVRWYREGGGVGYARALLLGIGFGLLPLVHGKSLLVVALVLLLMLAGCPGAWRLWLAIGIATVAVAAPLFHLLYGGIGNALPASWPTFQLGGMATLTDRYALHDWHLFWWLNRGLFLPLAAVALLFNRWWGQPVAQAGLLLFAAVNLMRFDPQLQDDALLLAWSQVLLAVPLAHLLGEMRRVIPFGSLPMLLLVVALTASGALDLWRLAGAAPGLHRVWGPLELQVAAEIRARTQTDDLFAVTPGHHGNWVPALTGRPVLLGDEALLPKHGSAVSAVRGELLQLLAGGRQTETRLRRAGIERVVLDSSAAAYDATGAAWFQANYPRLTRTGPYTVYTTLSWTQ